MVDWDEYGENWPLNGCIGCKWEEDCPEVDDDTQIYDC